MARLLSTANNLRLAQTSDQTDTSKAICSNNENEEGIPYRVPTLENELEEMHYNVNNQLNNQAWLGRGLRLQHAKNTVPRKFKGMEAANKSDINTTVDNLKNYAHMYTTIHRTRIPDVENPMTSDLATTILM